MGRLMSVLMVRSRVKRESAAELEAAAKAMFSALEEAQPEGVRYASCRLPDGVTYVALLELEDPANNPLVSLPAFNAFQDT